MVYFTSRPLYPGERIRIQTERKTEEGARYDRDVLEKRSISCHSQDSNPESSTRRAVNSSQKLVATDQSRRSHLRRQQRLKALNEHRNRMFFLQFPGSPDNRFSTPVTDFIDREARFPPLIQARKIQRHGKYCAGLGRCIPTATKACLCCGLYRGTG